MRSLSRYLLIALIAFAPSLRAQNVAHDGAPKAAPSSSSAPSPCDPDNFEPGSPLEVLSDTAGADFGRYLRDVARKIRINWHRVIPADARSSSSDKGCATVEFSIQKDGKLAGMKLVQSSGNASLESAAQAGVSASAPFDPLPDQFTGSALTLRFHFRYNPQHGRLTPLQGGGWHSTSAEESAGSPSVVLEPKTYNGQPVYRVGHGVTAPKGTYMPNPAFTESARKKKLQGTAQLEIVVTQEGNVGDAKVVKGIDPDLDESALDTVRKWKFDPATKDGKPVPVQIDVEVSFRLY